MTEFKSSKTSLQYNNDPLQNFLYALKAPDSKRQYPRRFEYFLDYLGLKGTLKEKCIIFYEQAKHEPLWTQHQIMQYVEFQKERAEKGEIAESTINNYYKSVKLFCEMNDIILNWKKIAKGKPQHRDYANDRAPTIEEIERLLKFPDRRIKVIVLVMISSGIRVGAWDYLKWKHIIPIKNDKYNEVIAAKIIVYAGTKEEYFSFITPEAFNALQEYIEFRSSCGEKITGESWLIRDIWKSTNIKFQNRGGLATVPRKLKSSGIRSIISRAEWEQGIREPLTDGKKRHEFQAVHSMRKYFKSHCEQVMKSINVEILILRKKVILPLWHNISKEEIQKLYPSLVNLVAPKTNEGIKNIANKLYMQIRGIKKLYNFNSDIELSKTLSPLFKSIKERKLLIKETEEEITLIILIKIYLHSKGYHNIYIYFWPLSESLSSNDIGPEILKKYMEILITQNFIESKSIGTISITHKGIKQIENLIENSKNDSNFSKIHQVIHSITRNEIDSIHEIQKLRYNILRTAYDLSHHKKEILNIFKIGLPLGIENEKLERIFFYLEHEHLIYFWALGGYFYITGKGKEVIKNNISNRIF